MLNIHISGEAGHGKDTVGLHLVERHGYVRTAFGNALKDEVVQAYEASSPRVTLELINRRETKNVPLAELALRHCADLVFVKVALYAFAAEDAAQGVSDVNQRMEMPRSPRRTMQAWGTEYRRRHCNNEHYWIDRVEDFVKQTNQAGRPVVICDSRSPAEIQWADAYGARRIHVFKTVALENTPRHDSEVIPPPCDRTAVLRNDDTIADLHQLVELNLMAFKAAEVGKTSAPRLERARMCP